jgi:hypothetical protein
VIAEPQPWPGWLWPGSSLNGLSVRPAGYRPASRGRALSPHPLVGEARDGNGGAVGSRTRPGGLTPPRGEPPSLTPGLARLATLLAMAGRLSEPNLC